MAKITLALVGLVNEAEVNQIIQELKNEYQINLVCVKTSWGRLWITEKEGDKP